MPLITDRALVWAQVQAPGFHRWPDATGTRAYLAQRHRHLFHLRAEAEVGHEDRETEFHDLGDAMRAWWGPGARECGSDSCEALARQLGEHLASLGMPPLTVTVSEDGECGATLTFRQAP